MEFGRVSERLLSHIDFKLPKDPSSNNSFLIGRKINSPRVHIGCSKWGRSEWIGKIFPYKTEEKDYLENYAKCYNGIELNTTHYKIHSSRTIGKWAEKTSRQNFVYCPKMFKEITHEGSLYGKKHITDNFIAGIAAFEEQLGPILIQLNESFSPKKINELFDYLKSLPTKYQFFVEIRHSEWFTNEAARNELITFLKENKIGLIITDTSGRRDCLHMQLTVSKAFIRYVGNGTHSSDYTRIDEWIDRIKLWIDNGIEEIYFFMHLQDEQNFPEISGYMIDKLNDVCGLNIRRPEPVKKKRSLFQLFF